MKKVEKEKEEGAVLHPLCTGLASLCSAWEEEEEEEKEEESTRKGERKGGSSILPLP